MILPRGFYLQDTEKIAKALLGQRFCRSMGRHVLSGTIVETEAYLGLKDPACHSYHGKKTPRVNVMYKEGGPVLRIYS